MVRLAFSVVALKWHSRGCCFRVSEKEETICRSYTNVICHWRVHLGLCRAAQHADMIPDDLTDLPGHTHIIYKTYNSKNVCSSSSSTTLISHRKSYITASHMPLVLICLSKLHCGIHIRTNIALAINKRRCNMFYYNQFRFVAFITFFFLFVFFGRICYCFLFLFLGWAYIGLVSPAHTPFILWWWKSFVQYSGKLFENFTVLWHHIRARKIGVLSFIRKVP